MKKWLYAMLAILLNVTLSACGEKPTADSPNRELSYQGVPFSSEVGASTISVLLPDGWECS